MPCPNVLKANVFFAWFAGLCGLGHRALEPGFQVLEQGLFRRVQFGTHPVDNPTGVFGSVVDE